MANRMKSLFCTAMLCMPASVLQAQNVHWISSTEGEVWKEKKVKMQASAPQTPLLEVEGTEPGTLFRHWGTTFNELCWDALNMLSRKE